MGDQFQSLLKASPAPVGLSDDLDHVLAEARGGRGELWHKIRTGNSSIEFNSEHRKMCSRPSERELAKPNTRSVCAVAATQPRHGASYHASPERRLSILTVLDLGIWYAPICTLFCPDSADD